MPATTPVSDVMTRDVVTVRPEQRVQDAADLMAERGFGAVPVVDDEGRIVGLLRDEDLLVTEANLHAPTVFSFLGTEFMLPGQLKHFDEDLRKAAAATVADMMTTEFETASPDESLEDLATRMHHAGVTHVPVVEDGKLVGIVARGDIVRYLARTTL